MPGMLLMSCFFVVCFFRAIFFFFRVVGFDFGFGFDLLIPGMLDISRCARTGKSASNNKLAKTSDQTLILKRKWTALMFFIIPLENSSAPKKSFDKKTSSSEDNRFGCLVKNERTRFSHKDLKRLGGG